MQAGEMQVGRVQEGGVQAGEMQVAGVQVAGVQVAGVQAGGVEWMGQGTIRLGLQTQQGIDEGLGMGLDGRLAMAQGLGHLIRSGTCGSEGQFLGVLGLKELALGHLPEQLVAISVVCVTKATQSLCGPP